MELSILFYNYFKFPIIKAKYDIVIEHIKYTLIFALLSVLIHFLNIELRILFKFKNSKFLIIKSKNKAVVEHTISRGL